MLEHIEHMLGCRKGGASAPPESRLPPLLVLCPAQSVG
jgi:hypothetical protein